MILADFIEGGGGGEGGNVAADIVLHAIGAHDHGQRVPADQALDAALDFLIAGERRLEAMRNGVGVRSVGGERQIDAIYGRMGAQTFKNFGGYFGAAGFEHGIKRLEPLLDFYVVDAMRLCKGLVVHDSDWSFFFLTRF